MIPEGYRCSRRLLHRRLVNLLSEYPKRFFRALPQVSLYCCIYVSIYRVFNNGLGN